MRTSNSAYNTKNANLQNNPVWVVEFAADTSKLFSTRNGFDETGKPGGSTILNYVRDIRMNMANIEVSESHLTSNEAVVEIVDKSVVFTNYLSTANIVGTEIIIRQGFLDISYSNFLIMWRGTITKFNPDETKLGWIIYARDNIAQLGKPIFRNIYRSTLNGAITGTPATFTVTLADGFVDPSTIPSTARIEAAVKIDNEIISYSSINYTTEVLTVATSGRNEAHTSLVDHADDAQVTQAFVFNEDPLRILLQILTSTDAGTNGPYDTGINGFGLEIPYASVDIEGIERLGWKLAEQAEWNPIGAAQCYIAAWQTENNALEWIEKWLLKPLGCYLAISSSNKILVRSNDYVALNENFSAAAALTRDETSDLTIEYSDEELVNRIEFHSAVPSGGSSIDYENDMLNQAESQAIYGVPVKNTLVEHPGGAFLKDIVTLKSNRMQNLLLYRFMLFLDPLVSLSFMAINQQSLLEPTDYVTITDGKMPDVTTGARGWTAKKCLLTGQEIVSKGKMRLSARTWEGLSYLRDDLSGYYDIEKVSEGSIDDKTVSLNADVTTVRTAIGSTDGLFLNDTLTAEADRIVFFLRITPPGSAGTTSETISIQIASSKDHATTPAFIKTDQKPYIRYNPQSSTAFVVELDLISDNESDIPDGLQVDWYDTSAGVGDRPTVEFIGAWFVLSKIRLS